MNCPDGIRRNYMNRTLLVAMFVGMATLLLIGCSSDPEPTLASSPVPTATFSPATGSPSLPAVPEGAEVGRQTAMLLGIDIHRQLWSTRPSDNYKFGFQWNVGEFAYQRSNVEVRIVKGVVDEVRWADNAIKTDGTEPSGFVVPDEPDTSDYLNVDELFVRISEAIINEPARVSLGFDSVFGFPTNVVIEFPPGSEFQDVSFFAAQLSPLPGPPE